jgi:hypothetical protein
MVVVMVLVPEVLFQPQHQLLLLLLRLLQPLCLLLLLRWYRTARRAGPMSSPSR